MKSKISANNFLNRSVSLKSISIKKNSKNKNTFQKSFSNDFLFNTSNDTNNNQSNIDKIDELEWDRYKDFLYKYEQDVMSNFDLNELTKEKFLEFEMMTTSNKSIDSCFNKNITLNNETSLHNFIKPSNNGLTIADLIRIKLIDFNTKINRNTISDNISIKPELENPSFVFSKKNQFNTYYAPITFDCESFIIDKNQAALKPVNRLFYSMPNLNLPCEDNNKIILYSNHLSLNDMQNCIEIQYKCKNAFLHLKAQNKEEKKSTFSFKNDIFKIKIKTRITSFLTRFGDCLKNFIHKTFNIEKEISFLSNRNLYSIDEEIKKSYDIIELDHILETLIIHSNSINQKVIFFFIFENKSYPNFKLSQVK